MLIKARCQTPLVQETIGTEEDILQLVREDDWMMEILRTAKKLNLPDWWVCAGFVRSKIWDTLHGFDVRTPIPDIDVIYFDETNTDEAEEKRLEEKLKSLHPTLPWSVKNEARMHVKNNIPPYTSSIDAISKFPETATALGVKLDEQDNLILTAPCGIKDVLHMEVRPTPYFKETTERAAIYEERIVNKNWKSIWEKINITHITQ
ncbi:nucleotidyltransferase family protein [Bacillus sp. FJAT-49736]|uniref:nucleotidyltransferase family protein n=1 Tax=Bacillus sp. FJAT-49736 TaxID=2833582 RepID=UPI001BC9255C|nr:nucleotidyltransferase family protein [Bacillus sp. FJAT-49736]MBS4174405.1 nucleotidyltransferase family protein [Bacillus sp. FJAT-49736]